MKIAHIFITKLFQQFVFTRQYLYVLQKERKLKKMSNFIINEILLKKLKNKKKTNFFQTAIELNFFFVWIYFILNL